MAMIDQNADKTAYTHGMADHDILRQAKRLIDNYIAFLGRARIGRDVLDVSELPMSRDTLINAFRLVIAAENRAPVREQLLKIGLTLAQFQEHIGARMSLQPVGRNEAATADDMLETMRANRDYLAKFDRVFAAIGPERAHLARLFKISMDIAVTRNARRPDPRQTSAGSSAFH